MASKYEFMDDFLGWLVFDSKTVPFHDFIDDMALTFDSITVGAGVKGLEEQGLIKMTVNHWWQPTQNGIVVARKLRKDLESRRPTHTIRNQVTIE